MVGLIGSSSETRHHDWEQNIFTTQLVWMGHCSYSVLRTLRFCVNDKFNDLAIKTCRDMSQRSERTIAHVRFFTAKSQAWIKFFSKPAWALEMSQQTQRSIMVWSYSSLTLTELHANCPTFLCHPCVWRQFLQSLPLQKTVKVDSLVLQQEQNKFYPAYQHQLIVSPNGLEWPPTANGDSIISEFHGICIALLHHKTVKIYFWKEKKKSERTWELCCPLNCWVKVGTWFGGL